MTIAPEVSTKDPELPPVPEGAVMVTLKIARFNPENPDAAGWQSFRVPCLPSDRLLNLLHYVKWYLDGTLTFRRSCAHGVCGSDAMRINGVNRLACKVLMRDMLPKKPGKQLTITIEPIRGLDRKSTRLNSSHSSISYAVFCLKKKKKKKKKKNTQIKNINIIKN